jgi:hypothetical protein
VIFSAHLPGNLGLRFATKVQSDSLPNSGDIGCILSLFRGEDKVQYFMVEMTLKIAAESGKNKANPCRCMAKRDSI